MIRAGLATFYLAFSATRLHGPLGLFERGRRRVLRARGFRYHPTSEEWSSDELVLGEGRYREPADDWVASGVTCPVCASLYVAPLVLALGRTERGRRLVSALAVAGLASAIYRAGE